MDYENTFSKVLDVINKLLAIIVLGAYAVFAINSNWEFITNPTIVNILAYVMYYGPVGLCCMVLLEFSVKRNAIIQIIVIILILVVVAFQFFPDTFNSIASRFS